MNIRSVIRHLIACLFLWELHAGDPGGISAYDLRCAGRTDPSGITQKDPVLNWKLSSPVRGDAQISWRVLAASSPELLGQDQGNLWDSGRVISPVASGTYRGKSLGSGERVYWKVKVSDSKGVDTAWSPVATWMTGIMKPGDWSDAKWIAAPLVSTNSSVLPGYGSSSRFRKEIVVKPGLRRAVMHLAGLGQYKLEVNGTDCTPALMTPGWTDSSKTILYDTIDLSDHLKQGTNAIMITLGGGMYRNPPSDRYAKFVTEPRLLKCRGVLDVSYSDGFSEKVRTDGTWHCIPSPITYGSIYGGEDHDARLESEKMPADAPLAFVLSGEMIPSGSLEGAEHAGPAIREIEVMRPVATNALTSNSFVVDLGQNAPIMPRITAHGPAGSAVRITPSELTNSRGELDDTMNRGKSFCTYTLKGGEAETWKPDFYYRGARYLKIQRTQAEGGSGLPDIDSVEGIVVHNTAQPVGRFACSNELFNRIYRLVRWAQRGNMMSVLTDCPQREKLGWLEQDHLNGPALRYNFGLDTLFSKICRDMSDAQTAEGLIPDIAPEYCKFSGSFRDSPEWGSACVLVPWQQYEFTGDPCLLNERYETMKRYVDYLAGKAKEGIIDYGLGDWYDIGPKPPGVAQLTPKALTATAFLWQDADILSKTALLLERKEDAVRYGELARRSREAFNSRFFDPVTANYAAGSQCANALPLVMGLVPEEKRGAVLGNLVKDVQEKGLTAGDVGYRYLLRALADGGRSDVIFELNNQSLKPGYGMQLAKGATSLTEAWDAGRDSSQNHFMLGQINEWFFRNLAGIQFDPEHPGFRHVLIRPTPVGDLIWAGADYDSVRGRISSWWKRSGKEFTLDVSIPPGCTATVTLPAKDPSSVKEGGKPAHRSPGVLGMNESQGGVSLEITSGTYRFNCPVSL